MKTIVIGCGPTMADRSGGPLRADEIPPEWFPHSLHTHPNCTTVDIDARCSPSVVLNFATPDPAELIGKIGNEKFDLIVLESLPNDLYVDSYFLGKIVTNCNYISNEIGHILIPLELDKNIELLEKAFATHGFRLIRVSDDFSLIYPIISAFTGRYTDEYMMRYRLQLLIYKKINLNRHYLLFKR